MLNLLSQSWAMSFNWPCRVQKLGQTFLWLLLERQMAHTACGQIVCASPGRHVTDGGSERVTVDNVCRGQESTFSKMTQNEIRKNPRLVLYHLEIHKAAQTHTQERKWLTGGRTARWTRLFRAEQELQLLTALIFNKSPTIETISRLIDSDNW